jgi:outer membrane protein OmpA-like peptidoglycan-associated protein
MHGLRLLLTAALLTPAALLAQREDHELLTRYAGSTVEDKTFQEFGAYKLAVGLDQSGQLVGRPLEGRLTRFIYQNPPGRSALEIYRNYTTALNAAGLKTVFACTGTQCGPSYAMSMWGRFNGLAQAATSGDPHYVAGSISRPGGGTAWIAVMVGTRRTQVDIVEIVAMDEGMVVADAAALARGLDALGRVVVPGIYFDTDQAVVKPESRPALEQVARLLRDRPELRLFVVGHTDMTGDLAHNRTLSEARARAVVAALVAEHGVAAARLEGHGVGPLAPAAGNESEATRSRNRRVELVKR